jgi:hypothetical protein
LTQLASLFDGGRADHFHPRLGKHHGDGHLILIELNYGSIMLLGIGGDEWPRQQAVMDGGRPVIVDFSEVSKINTDLGSIRLMVECDG